jgi:hypothetical protein
VSKASQIPPISSSADAFDMFYRSLRFEALPLHSLSWYLMIPLVSLIGFQFRIPKQVTFNPSKMPQSSQSLLTHRILQKTPFVVDVELFSSYASTETRWLQVEWSRKLYC